jgi:general secretion pathway protein D
MRTITIKNIMLVLLTTWLLNACATVEPTFAPKKSFLSKNETNDETDVTLDKEQTQSLKPQGNKSNAEKSNVSYVEAFSATKVKYQNTNNLVQNFSNSEMIKVTADNLPLKDYLHYVMGDLLHISYVLGESASKDKQKLTLNLQESISKRSLYLLSEKLLDERGYLIRLEDGIYYIHEKDKVGGTGTITYGYGNKPSDVPISSNEIMQLSPFMYGYNSQITLIIGTLAKVKVIPAATKNAMIIRGKYDEIVKALEFITLMDQSGYLNRSAGVYKPTFISVDLLTLKIPELLEQEGISVGNAKNTSKALSIVTLENINSIVFFVNDKAILERAIFWAKELDQPVLGNTQQYFIYQPQYSRAVDLGESLEPLLSGSASLSSSISASGQNDKNKNKNKTRKFNVSGGDSAVDLVVDERSNTIIIQTTGEKYKQLLPLIKRLDVMPKQVMLEVLIAEVTLTDEFKQGVEFAFNNGSYGFSTQGAFMGEGFGGLSYALSGANIDVAINMFASNSLVEVLSRPSLVVRDGVSANITVGTDIPIVGQTTSDPINGDNQTTSIEYRKTGIDLAVTPTINGQGVVMMEIKQSISTQVKAGSTVADSPAIFERAVQTEVVAESGQTVVLGGMISKNRSTSETKVPWLGDIPLIGALFKGKADSGDKTELVILVTPRVIESQQEWQGIKNKFSTELEMIDL